MTYIFVLCGLLFIILAIPLIRRKVKPNRWYGFRVQKTLESPQTWYAGNAYAGKLMLGFGILFTIASILVPILWPTVSMDNYAWIMSGLLLIGILLVLIISYQFVNRL